MPWSKGVDAGKTTGEESWIHQQPRFPGRKSMWTVLWQSHCKLQRALVALSPREKNHSGWCVHIARPALLAGKLKRRNPVLVVLSLVLGTSPWYPDTSCLQRQRTGGSMGNKYCLPRGKDEFPVSQLLLARSHGSGFPSNSLSKLRSH